MVEAVVFDFDGTIADTESLEYETWSEEFVAHGVSLDLDEWIQCVGGGNWNVLDHLETLTGPLDRSAVVASRRARFDARAEGLDTRTGVRGLIAQLDSRGTSLAVASSSYRGWVCGYLAEFGLAGSFPVVVTRDDVQQTKPAPDLFLLAAQRIGVPPAQCVAIEDSPKGIAAAREAGMKVVAFPNPVTESFDLSGADLVVRTLEDPDLAALLGL